MRGIKWTVAAVVTCFGIPISSLQVQAESWISYRLPVVQVPVEYSTGNPGVTYHPEYLWVKYLGGYQKQMNHMALYEWAMGMFTLAPRGWISKSSAGNHGSSVSIYNPSNRRESISVYSYWSEFLSDIAQPVAAVFPQKWSYFKEHNDSPSGVLPNRPRPLTAQGYRIYPIGQYEADAFLPAIKRRPNMERFFGWDAKSPSYVQFSMSYGRTKGDHAEASLALSFFAAYASQAENGRGRIW